MYSQMLFFMVSSEGVDTLLPPNLNFDFLIPTSLRPNVVDVLNCDSVNQVLDIKSLFNQYAKI